MAFHCKSNCK